MICSTLTENIVGFSGDWTVFIRNISVLFNFEYIIRYYFYSEYISIIFIRNILVLFSFGIYRNYVRDLGTNLIQIFVIFKSCFTTLFTM